MTASELRHVVETLASTQSSNQKIEYLNQFFKMYSEKDIKKYFSYCLDPQFKYGVSSAHYDEKSTDVHLDSIDELDTLWEVVETFLTDKKNIEERIAKANLTLSWNAICILDNIFKHDSKCSVSKATYRKVFKAELRGAKICKAVPYSEKAMESIEYPCYAQEKADGARCLCFSTADGVTFVSSSGKEFLGFTEQMKSDIREFTDRAYKDMVFDGELLVMNEDGTVCDRKTGNGILNKALHNTITPEEASRIRFVMWDCVTKSDYDEGRSSLPYKYRWEYLQNEMDSYKSNHGAEPKNLGLIDTCIIYGLSDVKKEFQKKLSEGKEGIIVKNKNFKWEGKRLKECVKFKLELESTLKVVGWEYGTGGTKYEQCLGALVCESSDGLVRVHIGSGVDEQYRKNFMNREQKTGFFVEVRSNGLIKDESGSWSLFLPRMIEERFDKTEADSFKTIKALQEASCALGM